MGISKMGFYYEQEGFYYNQPKGFYYNQLKQQEGFYYDQRFYYNQDQGFYYDQQQEGFYYDQQDGDHAKFSKENKDYWYKGEGRERVVKALNGLRTLVDDYVTKKPHPANEIQGQALSNVVTIQVVREVIKKFIKNIDPDEFFKNGGNEESLATLLAKECQGILSPAVDYRAAWQEEGSEAKKAMDQVTNEIVPFMVSYLAKQPFHKPIDLLRPRKAVQASRLHRQDRHRCRRRTPQQRGPAPECRIKLFLPVSINTIKLALHR